MVGTASSPRDVPPPLLRRLLLGAARSGLHLLRRVPLMPTPVGYVPTEAEKLAHRDRQQRLRTQRRADPARGLPAEARVIATTIRRFARRLAAHPLPLHPADAPVLADSLALLVNEAEVVNSILNPPHPRSR